MYLTLQFLILIIGFVFLVKGSDFFVMGAAGIAKKFGIPELVIGLTIVAMGTSAPEAAVSITGVIKGSADISVGNILGSNILNILIILGLSSVIIPIAVAQSSIRYEIPFTAFISVMLLILGYDRSIGRTDGIILWVFFIWYFYYLFRMVKQNPQEASIDTEETPDMPIIKTIVLTILGLAMVIAGSHFAVDSASNIARTFGLSERFIGLTIVALGTSLPELFTSIQAARHHSTDIAIGNIIGSNIFNILFVIGTSSLIMPIPFASRFQFDAAVAIGACILLFFCSLPKHKIGRISGILMLISYALYFAYIAFNAKLPL
ncbi:MAG: calcium/sodium antiporter [Treponema sp.]|nr:calcium/sodium antiporter [Treponema sp.]